MNVIEKCTNLAQYLSEQVVNGEKFEAKIYVRTNVKTFSFKIKPSPRSRDLGSPGLPGTRTGIPTRTGNGKKKTPSDHNRDSKRWKAWKEKQHYSSSKKESPAEADGPVETCKEGANEPITSTLGVLQSRTNMPISVTPTPGYHQENEWLEEEEEENQIGISQNETSTENMASTTEDMAKTTEDKANTTEDMATTMYGMIRDVETYLKHKRANAIIQFENGNMVSNYYEDRYWFTELLDNLSTQLCKAEKLWYADTDI